MKITGLSAPCRIQATTGADQFGKIGSSTLGPHSRDTLSISPPIRSDRPWASTSDLQPSAANCKVWQGQWHDETATEAFARKLADSPAILNATLTLHGDLGAGKTTLVRHLLRALGVEGRIKSPTYAVVEPHQSLRCRLLPQGEALHIWHFDFYRFTDPREWEDAGFRELFAAPGLKLVEWPERAAGYLPPVDADIRIQTDPMPTPTTPTEFDETAPVQRSVAMNAFTPEGRQLLASLTA